MRENINRKRLIIFGGFTLVFLIILSIVRFFNMENNNILLLLMLTPAFSVIITRIITKEGVKDLFIKPHFKGNIKWYVMPYLLTPIIAYIGAIIYFLILPSQFDMLNSSFAISTNIAKESEYIEKLMQVIPLAIIVNPIAGIIQCFGEEFAWRAYLLPKLNNKFKVSTAVIITGVVWGLWHSPIIAMGFNYGTEYPLLGVIAMIIFCLVLGIIQAYLFFKTKSVWAPVLFHAAINGMDLWAPSTFFMSTKANPFIGPDLLGTIGGIGLIIVSVFCFADICKHPKKFQLS